MDEWSVDSVGLCSFLKSNYIFWYVKKGAWWPGVVLIEG